SGAAVSSAARRFLAANGVAPSSCHVASSATFLHALAFLPGSTSRLRVGCLEPGRVSRIRRGSRSTAPLPVPSASIVGGETRARVSYQAHGAATPHHILAHRAAT